MAKFLAAISGLAILAMIAVTCADVVMRKLNHPLSGSVDICKYIATIAIACALPYTTAVKGHVAIEFLFQKMSRRWRIVVDTAARLLVIALFCLLAWQCVKLGLRMKITGEVTPTIKIPLYWAPWIVAFSCAMVVPVKIHNLIHPGTETIEP